jgi:mannose-6-phosphate isomerase-like protein (cupin superfamily)
MQKQTLDHDKRPWGEFQVIDSGDGFQVKRIIVLPGKRLSLQSHKFRKEHWVVSSGEAEVEINNKISKLTIAESIDIPLGAIHRLSNKSKSKLIIIEIQFGSYLGEDDIIRYEDDFNRT